MNKGLLIVVSGPSGCGKGTILAEVLKNGNFYYSVSATTRAPRPGEVDGVNYSFLTKEKFEELINNDGMLEHAYYCGNYYGTPKEQVMKNLGELLKAGGASFESAIKTTCFLADMNDFSAFNEIYGKYFTSKPARSCVAVKELPKGVLCEVEVIAEIL